MVGLSPDVLEAPPVMGKDGKDPNRWDSTSGLKAGTRDGKMPILRP